MTERLACVTQCNSEQGCEAMEQFDITHGRDALTYVAATGRCHDYNLAGGYDGNQQAGTACFIGDVTSVEVVDTPEGYVISNEVLPQEAVHA